MNPIVLIMTFTSFILVMGVRYGAQAAVARLLGDGSQAREGRLTLNPARHLAPLGTCVALLFSFPISGVPVGLGWGKPIVPDGRRIRFGGVGGGIIVALAGILTNLALGIGLAFALSQIRYPTHAANCLNTSLLGGPLQGCLAAWQPGWLLRVEQFGFIFAGVNIVIGLLNLIPLYPLDGYTLLYAVLPNATATRYRNSQATQEIILVVALFVVPLLLSFAGLPAYLAPGTLVNALAFSVLDLFTPFSIFAQRL